ncbi:helix-turn-helix domain-containing protein, partial [Parabacteroides distasonis]|nr:helix-turn-helix domain-containing protein [Parabacteroides distasonis]
NIAMDLGFNNLSFFNKFFRRNVGMTPQEYRGKSYTYSCYQKTSD